MKEGIAQTLSETVKEKIFDYMKSDGPGGQEVISAFMSEFEKLSRRAPSDDPTNIKNHLSFILSHIKKTWDESLEIADDGTINIGICTDDVLGFDVDYTKLRHQPSPVVWTVFLIRGIGGRYAFVNEQTYFLKHGKPMPPVYHGGFLISRGKWKSEGWEDFVGPFEMFEHPSSGAPPIPFLRNVVSKIDIRSIINEAISEAINEVPDAIN